jgi:hypothetical protein
MRIVKIVSRRWRRYRRFLESETVRSTSNSVPLVGGDRKAFGARRFPFPAFAAMSAFSDFAPSFETPAASSDRSAFPGEVIGR